MSCTIAIDFERPVLEVERDLVLVDPFDLFLALLDTLHQNGALGLLQI